MRKLILPIFLLLIGNLEGARVWEACKDKVSYDSNQAIIINNGSALDCKRHGWTDAYRGNSDFTHCSFDGKHFSRCGPNRSPSTDGCPDFSTAAILKLDRKTWWHCDGPATDCLHRLLSNVVASLHQPECKSGRCLLRELPSQVVSLRLLEEHVNVEQAKSSPMPAVRSEKGALPSNNNNNNSTCTPASFNTSMELVANVIIQKARYCRFDLGAFSRLVKLVTDAYRAELKCTKKAVLNPLESDDLSDDLSD